MIMEDSDQTFLPFSLPDIGGEEISEVIDTLRSGWLTTSPKTKRFEEDFARYMGSGVEALAVNSATAGLHLALEGAGIGPGDEVITTPYTFTATAEVIRYLGADPVFVDVRPDTLMSIAEQDRGSNHRAHQGDYPGSLRQIVLRNELDPRDCQALQA